MQNPFILSLGTLRLLFFVAVLGLAMAYGAVRAFDKWLWPDVHFDEELSKDNVAVAKDNEVLGTRVKEMNKSELILFIPIAKEEVAGVKKKLARCTKKRWLAWQNQPSRTAPADGRTGHCNPHCAQSHAMRLEKIVGFCGFLWVFVGFCGFSGSEKASRIWFAQKTVECGFAPK